jgi:predicted RNase H-like HicB family nuclease
MSTEIQSFTVAVYDAEVGGYWGEVLELPGCASQGETIDELLGSVRDAILACLETYAEDDEHPRKRVMTFNVSLKVPA